MLASSYMRLGFVFYTMGDYEIATKTYYNALSIAERINNPKIVSWACNLLGLNFKSKPNLTSKSRSSTYLNHLKLIGL